MTTEFQVPRISAEKVDDNRGTFTVEPLDKGFGYTFGNSLRRVLLSSLGGAAIIGTHTRPAMLLPHAKRHPLHVVAVACEQRRGHRAIDPPAHRHHDLLELRLHQRMI